MNQKELAKEVNDFIESEEFRESGALDSDGDVDFGPASVAISSFVEELEESEDDAADAEPPQGSEK